MTVAGKIAQVSPTVSNFINVHFLFYIEQGYTISDFSSFQFLMMVVVSDYGASANVLNNSRGPQGEAEIQGCSVRKICFTLKV